MASVIAGVPASNFHGSSFVVKPSLRTSRIISPPPRNGGIASSSSRRPHSAPMPDGPSILCAVMATKSASHACTSIARCGAACDASTSTCAPAAFAAATSGGMSFTVPSTFDIAVIASSLAPASSASRSVRSRR